MDFYDEVLRELLVAMGAALFLGNLLALLRRRRPPAPNEMDEDGTETAVAAAPVARTLTYAVMGFVIMIWGIASLAAN